MSMEKNRQDDFQASPSSEISLSSSQECEACGAGLSRECIKCLFDIPRVPDAPVEDPAKISSAEGMDIRSAVDKVLYHQRILRKKMAYLEGLLFECHRSVKDHQLFLDKYRPALSLPDRIPWDLWKQIFLIITNDSPSPSVSTRPQLEESDSNEESHGDAPSSFSKMAESMDENPFLYFTNWNPGLRGREVGVLFLITSAPQLTKFVLGNFVAATESDQAGGLSAVVPYSSLEEFEISAFDDSTLIRHTRADVTRLLTDAAAHLKKLTLRIQSSSSGDGGPFEFPNLEHLIYISLTSDFLPSLTLPKLSNSHHCPY
ncbi:hypothetical protein DL96DRAFT_1791504 [Flagelloscypha sp. PMI_526]|nr:hypothetical protein DL96DRAFT_1791504 [Flagelloscypha sp. PMI_526]